MRHLYAGAIIGMIFACASAPAHKEAIVLARRDIVSVTLIDTRVAVTLTEKKAQGLTWTEVWRRPIRFADLNIPPDILKSMYVRQVTTSSVVSSITFVLPDETTAKRFADALKIPAATK
jgi:hypothetical protein